MDKKICVVFDVDGTLFDTKREIIKALNYVLKSYRKGEIASDEEDKYIGPPIKKSMMEYQGFKENEAIEATALYRQVYVDEFVQKSVAYDGIESVLKHFLAYGIVIGIATMKTLPQVDKLLTSSGFDKYFNIVEAAREDGTLSKSQMLVEIKKKYSDLERFIMVGDTIGDYNAAIDAGYEFISADYGYGNIQEINCKHVKCAEELINVL